mgnify:CR=1 FL=1
MAAYATTVVAVLALAAGGAGKSALQADKDGRVDLQCDTDCLFTIRGHRQATTNEMNGGYMHARRVKRRRADGPKEEKKASLLSPCPDAPKLSYLVSFPFFPFFPPLSVFLLLPPLPLCCAGAWLLLGDWRAHACILLGAALRRGRSIWTASPPSLPCCR